MILFEDRGTLFFNRLEESSVYASKNDTSVVFYFFKCFEILTYPGVVVITLVAFLRRGTQKR